MVSMMISDSLFRKNQTSMVIYSTLKSSCLVKNVSITNYSFWTSSEGVPHLVIDSEKELCEEFRLICDAIHQQDNEMDFKNYKDDERIFIKLNKNCEKNSPNCSLTLYFSFWALQKACMW